MAIDINNEPVFPLRDVPQLSFIPNRRGGSRLNVATAFRWALRGLRGVRLEVVSVGGQKCTSVQALNRFFNTLAEGEKGENKTKQARGRERSKPDPKCIQQELDRLGL